MGSCRHPISSLLGDSWFSEGSETPSCALLGMSLNTTPTLDKCSDTQSNCICDLDIVLQERVAEDLRDSCGLHLNNR